MKKKDLTILGGLKVMKERGKVGLKRTETNYQEFMITINI